MCPPPLPQSLSRLTRHYHISQHFSPLRWQRRQPRLRSVSRLQTALSTKQGNEGTDAQAPQAPVAHFLFGHSSNLRSCGLCSCSVHRSQTLGTMVEMHWVSGFAYMAQKLPRLKSQSTLGTETNPDDAGGLSGARGRVQALCSESPPACVPPACGFWLLEAAVWSLDSQVSASLSLSHGH